MQLHEEVICHYIRLAWSVLDGEPKRLKWEVPLVVPPWKRCNWRLSGLPNQIPIQINNIGISSVSSCWLSLPSPQWNMSFHMATGNVLLQDFFGPGLLQGWLREHLLAAEMLKSGLLRTGEGTQVGFHSIEGIYYMFLGSFGHCWKRDCGKSSTSPRMERNSLFVLS